MPALARSGPFLALILMAGTVIGCSDDPTTSVASQPETTPAAGPTVPTDPPIAAPTTTEAMSTTTDATPPTEGETGTVVSVGMAIAGEDDERDSDGDGFLIIVGVELPSGETVEASCEDNVPLSVLEDGGTVVVEQNANGVWFCVGFSIPIEGPPVLEPDQEP